jgi:pimeloyl-ACP methyl ester carboxylesterase
MLRVPWEKSRRSGDATDRSPAGREHVWFRPSDEQEQMSMRDEDLPIDVAQSALDDMHRRIRDTRWPDQLADTTWEHGADLRYIRELASTWVESFDWRAVESALNVEMPSRRCAIGDLDIHFTQTVPDLDPSERGLPIVLLHGWPSSFVEMRKLVPQLVRAGHEVIVPSLPGHGFSSIPSHVGFGADECAPVIAALMTDVLGHERFVAHGGDRGSFVATSLGVIAPVNVAGIHLTLPGGIPGEGAERTAEETEWLTTTAAWSVEEGGYSAIQGTRPQSLAYAMHDSPVGMLAWIVEKHRAWSDCGGEVERCISREQLLANATIYWVTGTFRSASHWYWEHRVRPPAAVRPVRIDVPTAVVRYPKEVMRTPRSAVARKYRLVRWTDRPTGGHFPAYEDPDNLAADLLAFAADLRPTSS